MRCTVAGENQLAFLEHFRLIRDEVRYGVDRPYHVVRVSKCARDLSRGSHVGQKEPRKGLKASPCATEWREEV